MLSLQGRPCGPKKNIIMNNILKKHCIRVSENIGVAIQRLDGLDHDVRQLAVIDDKNIYRGDITDCHIRLSIFNGLDASDCISDLLLMADKSEIDVGLKSNSGRTRRAPFSRKLVVEKNINLHFFNNNDYYNKKIRK